MKSKIAVNRFTVCVQDDRGEDGGGAAYGDSDAAGEVGWARAVVNQIQVSEAARAKASKNLKRTEVKRGGADGGGGEEEVLKRDIEIHEALKYSFSGNIKGHFQRAGYPFGRARPKYRKGRGRRRRKTRWR